MTQNIIAPTWSFGRKLRFRLSFAFFGLIIFPFPLDVIPGVNKLFGFINAFWTWLINLLGKTFFGIEEEIAITFTGSGDKLYDWLWYFSIIVLTILIVALFSLLDRNRKSYHKLQGWFNLFLRYYLIYFLLVYGIIKLFYLQFGPPNLERLYQTFGQASPMRLMWTFMGFSETYTMFSGFSETVAGLLLLFRNTRILGALAATGVMLNVFMMNMSYDIPVKLFSFQLMLIGFYFICMDYKRVLGFFIKNEDVQKLPKESLTTSKSGSIVLTIFQVAFVLFIIINLTTSSAKNRKTYGPERAKSALYGVYNIETFVMNGDTLPPLLTDVERWKRILFDYPQSVSVVHMSDKVIRYNSEIDTINETIELAPMGDSINKYLFNYAFKGKDLFLEGVFYNDTLKVETKNYDLKNFGLLNRGFNWVNEVPYNRYNTE